MIGGGRLAVVDAERGAPVGAPARPTGRRPAPAARAGSGARGGRRSPARAPPRTDRRGPASRCRSPAGRRRRGTAARAGGRRRGCPRSSGRRRRSCPSRPAARRRARRRGCRGRGSCAGPRKPVRCSSSIGRAPVLGPALLELAPLLVRVHVADEAVLVGVGGERLEPRRRDGAHRVGGDARRETPRVPAAHSRRRVDALQERLRRGRRSGAGPARARGPPRPSRCGGRRRRSGRPRGPAPRPPGRRSWPARSGLRVRRAVGLVVDVVELADRAVARPRAISP